VSGAAHSSRDFLRAAQKRRYGVCWEMPLNNASILILQEHAPTGHALVKVVSDARGDVVFAGTAMEALQRLQQFQFEAAVIDAQVGSDRVVAELGALDIPFCVCAQSAPPGLTLVSQVDQVVPVLIGFLAP
jgi:CheY-like chemotaxis protein